MRRAEVIPVAESLAIEAADLALAHRLAMADAIVLATARRHDARLITADSGFAGLPNVIVIE